MLKKWTTEIDQITSEYISEFSGMSNSDLNYKPNERSWSIGQCMDHIVTTNQQYFDIFEKVNEGIYNTHWISKMPFYNSFMGNMILKSISPETIQKKNKTFPVFEPSTSHIPMDIIPRFENMQLKLKAYLAELNPANYDVVISSPVSRYVVYPLGKAIEIIIAHEKRHLLQAKAVKEMLGQ